MSANFKIEYKQKNGDLHVNPSGDFDGSSACELINLLSDRYDGHGKVLIDTGGLRRLCPFGCSTFQCLFRLSRVPVDRLLFKGENGRALAPEGCHVHGLDKTPHCRCNGQCANCRCANHARDAKNNQKLVIDIKPFLKQVGGETTG